jgi:hypothetical protein
VTRTRYIAIAVSFALAACGHEGKSAGDSCPDLPLYRYVYDADAGTWTRVVFTGDASHPLSDDAAADITEAEEHCITPPGNARSINSIPSGAGGSRGTGGSTGTGGARSDAGVK